MKRWLAALLAAVMLLAGVAAAMPVFAKGVTVGEVLDLFVSVPNNQAKTLKLTWNGAYIKADGYEVFRSGSGKKGTYQKIASVKKETYTDSKLKNTTVYYYAVRAFVKSGGKTYYGPFAKDYAFTKITKAFALKKLNKAQTVCDNWIFMANDQLLDYDHPYKTRETVSTPGEQPYVRETYYYPLINKKFTTKAQVKKYLSKYFVEWNVEPFVDAFYLERGGKLYFLDPEWGDGAGKVRGLDKVRDLVQRKYWATFSVLETWEDPWGRYNELQTYTLYEQGGKWVFGDAEWFPAAY